MGIISRRVLPACGSLCICCPELRARSRQPVKRYKKLLSDIFPKSQEELPNDRKIGKLIDYASKNPLRIPKIASALEQRGYKALRNERYSTVRVVMRAYSKLLSTCRDQMPLFAASALTATRILLEQVRNDDMQVLSCWTLVDFLSHQTDSTYMRDLDVFLPKLCALSRETGEELRRLPLRAAALEALASVVDFMGKYSHVPPEFDDIVGAVLDNYETLSDQEAEAQSKGETRNVWVKEVLKGEGRGPVAVLRGAMTKLHANKENFHLRDGNLTRIESRTPKVWSQICIQNMAKLAKEATTVRRVLEPMFRYFDAGKYWPPEKLALAVLHDMQYFMEKSGNEQLSLPVLVRHLDQKHVMDNIQLKTSIVEVTAQLARQSNAKASVADVGAMRDLLRHLRKSIHSSLEVPKTSDAKTVTHKGLRHALEECVIDLAKRVGDAAPIFDLMATALENLSANPNIARTTTETVCLLAQCVAYFLDQSYAEQVFPEALFQQLLQAMIHSDVETRVMAHHVFALLLVPSSFIPTSEGLSCAQIWPEQSSTLLRSSSAFGSVAALFEKLTKEKSAFLERDQDPYFESSGPEEREPIDTIETTETGASRCEDTGQPISSPNWPYVSKLSKEQLWELSIDRSMAQLRSPANGTKGLELSIVRLSGHQAALLLSALWLQGILPDNVPSSYEAIANSYILTLLFSRAKTSSHRTVIRAFQLALSLRSLAVDPCYAGIQLPPSRRRSVFTLSTAMLVFASRAYGVPQLGAVVKASLTSTMKDPYLELSDDTRLKIVNSPAGFVNVKDYGSAADDRDAYKSFSGICTSEEQTPEALAALIVGSCTVLGVSAIMWLGRHEAKFKMDPDLDVQPDDFAIVDQMLQAFSPVEGCGLGPHLCFETPYSRGSPLESGNTIPYDEVILHTNLVMDSTVLTETSGDELPRLLTSVPVPSQSPRGVGVSLILEAALVSAGQVASFSTVNTALSYMEVASQCETFFCDSRKRMSSALNLDGEDNSLLLTVHEKYWDSTIPMEEEQKHEILTEGFRLPPASPYDNFLKAAGY